MKARPFNIIDLCAFAYNGTILGLVLLFHSRLPSWPLLILPNVIAIAVVFLLAIAVGEGAGLVPRLVRNLFPLAFFLPLYAQIGDIDRIFFPDFLDPLFIRLEESIFGFQPAAAFARRFPHVWFAEYMHFAYASYYFLFPGLGAFLYLRRDRTAFLDYMFSLCVTMYVCLLTFIVLPVKGAVSLGIVEAPQRVSLPFTEVMAWIYRHLEIEGGAFPSSHVAVASVVLYYTVRYARSAAWAMAPLVISLIAATVYCRYHYAVDALAGLATAAALIAVCRRVNPTLRPR